MQAYKHMIRTQALAGLTANEETTLHPARGNMPAIVIMPCEDVDVDPEHRRRAIAHREELAKRLGKGLAPVTLPKKGDKVGACSQLPIKGCRAARAEAMAITGV
jgi:hypothetical protein